MGVNREFLAIRSLLSHLNFTVFLFILNVVIAFDLHKWLFDSDTILPLQTQQRRIPRPRCQPLNRISSLPPKALGLGTSGSPHNLS
jgi:hypothetical protein